MTPIRIPAAIALVLSSAASYAAPLWQKAESGMTIAQIKAAYPSARVPDKIGTLGNGARCELAIEGYEVSADTYQVCFYFAGNSLKQVMLSADDPTESQFDATVDLLRSKYGPELGAGQPMCKSGILRMCEAKWSLKTGTNVSVLYMRVGNSEPVMNIAYQTRMASEASKL